MDIAVMDIAVMDIAVMDAVRVLQSCMFLYSGEYIMVHGELEHRVLPSKVKVRLYASSW